jgi:uncharacterized protein (TIGR00290 family)
VVRVLVSWSTGKDSAWCLHTLRAASGVEVVGLLATVNEAYSRVAMHGVRYELLQAQSAAVGLPLVVVRLPSVCSNATYDAAMEEVMTRARDEGVEAVAFGDLFLEDVRRYREERLGRVGMAALFPLWGQPTRALAEEMIVAGLRARLTCVDPRALPAAFAGREFDHAFLGELPAGVDPCGENGEFHSFAWDGPMLARPIGVQMGEVVLRDGFVFADLLPAGTAP